MPSNIHAPHRNTITNSLSLFLFYGKIAPPACPAFFPFRTTSRLLCLSCSIFVIGVATQVEAQTFPERTIRLIVRAPQDGSTDALARLVTLPMQNILWPPASAKTPVGSLRSTAMFALSQDHGATRLRPPR